MERDTPEVLMLLAEVGVAVPVAIFQNFTVHVQPAHVPAPVPSSTVMSQLLIVPAFAAT